MESLKKISILTALFVLISLPAAYASFEVEPGTTVKAGQEILFNACSYLATPNGISSTFEWDFGDAWRQMTVPLGEQGISATHIYLYPGQYTVTLSVTYLGVTNQETTTITVQEPAYRENPMNLLNPLIRLGFENTISDSTGRGWTSSYTGTQNYRRGPILKGFDLNGSYARLQNTTSFNNLNEFTISFYARKKNKSDEGVIFDAGNIRFAYNTCVLYPGETYKLYVTTSSVSVTPYCNWVPASLYDNLWHLYVINYDGSRLHVYVDGQEPGPSQPCTGTVSLGNNITIGANQAGTSTFNGEIDEFTMSDKCFSYDDVAYGFELVHASFHARYSQYIYAKIPPKLLLTLVNRLLVKVESGSGYSVTIYDKTSPLSEEKMLLNNFELPSGNYTLTAQLLDSAGNTITQVKEYFPKPFAGVPKVGIDKNNSLRVNSALYFPVTPYELNDGGLFLYWGQTTRVINTLMGKGNWLLGGFGGERSLAAWQYYLDRARSVNPPLKAIGPLIWEGYYFPEHKYTGDINPMFNYAEATKNDDAVLGWHWSDEAELYGLCSRYIRSWYYATESRDTQHPTSINFAGSSWRKPIYGGPYSYMYNERYFGGKKTFIADIYSFDHYPINMGPEAHMYEIPDCIEHIRRETDNLIPIYSIIEPNEDTACHYTTRPSPEQVTMEGWLCIVHGAKAVIWFDTKASNPYEPVSPENMAAMKTFLDQVTALTPVILGPEVSTNVIDNANDLGNRVDTMVRKDDNGNLYLFAVRLTEKLETTPAVINVTFNISGITNATAEVYDESRTINVNAGSFADSFPLNAVHIYKIPLSAAIGDVSGDGAITAYDAALVAQAVVGLRELTPEQAIRADVSGDGVVSAYDAALIAQYVVGLRTEFPVEE